MTTHVKKKTVEKRKWSGYPGLPSHRHHHHQKMYPSIYRWCILSPVTDTRTCDRVHVCHPPFSWPSQLYIQSNTHTHTHIDTHRLYVQSWQWKNFEGDRNQHLPLHGNPTVRPVSQFSFFFLYVCVCVYGRQCEPSRLCHLTVGFHLVYASHLFPLTVAYMVYNAIRFCDRRRSGFLRLVSAIAVVAAFHDDDDDVGTVWPDCVKRK